MPIKPPILDTNNGPCAAFDVKQPQTQTLPFVFCSPHSGRDYPRSFLAASKLSGEAVRRSEDLFVDQLFDFTPDLGAPLLRARFPRAFLDVNREPFELDPRMFDRPLPGFVNAASARVAGGLGTIPRIVAEKQEIYREKLSATEAMQRIATIYQPFHEQLKSLLEATRDRFGLALLIDCHSMPTTVRSLPGGRRPDIVVGDRFGSSAANHLVLSVIRILSAMGYEVTRNKPYAGGYITETYGRPVDGTHAVQIEISRGLYANERTLEPKAGFDTLRQDLKRFVETLSDEIGSRFPYSAAAE